MEYHQLRAELLQERIVRSGKWVVSIDMEGVGKSVPTLFVCQKVRENVQLTPFHDPSAPSQHPLWYSQKSSGRPLLLRSPQMGGSSERPHWPHFDACAENVKQGRVRHYAVN